MSLSDHMIGRVRSCGQSSCASQVGQTATETCFARRHQRDGGMYCINTLTSTLRSTTGALAVYQILDENPVFHQYFNGFMAAIWAGINKSPTIVLPVTANYVHTIPIMHASYD
jgi:hypothetical protein